MYYLKLYLGTFALKRALRCARYLFEAYIYLTRNVRNASGTSTTIKFPKRVCFSRLSGFVMRALPELFKHDASHSLLGLSLVRKLYASRHCPQCKTHHFRCGKFSSPLSVCSHPQARGLHSVSVLGLYNNYENVECLLASIEPRSGSMSHPQGI